MARKEKDRPWRKIRINGETFVTNANNPCHFIVRKARETNKRRSKRGDYYLGHGTMVFHEHVPLGKFEVVGVYEDKACTKRIHIR